VKNTSALVIGVVAALVVVAAFFGLHRVPVGERWLRFDASGRPGAEVGAGVHWWFALHGAPVRFPAASDTIV
jgi:hypothetical protein